MVNGTAVPFFAVDNAICADVAGLLLSRAVQRRKEIAIRAAMGAGLGRLARQLITESLTLTVLGSVAGIAMARVLLHFLAGQLAALPIVLPHLQTVTLNNRVLTFNVTLCVLLASALSFAPIWMAATTDPNTALRCGRGATGSRRSTRLFSILIGAETALTFLLLTGSGLMIRSLVRLQNTDHGIHADHVLTMRVPIGTRTSPRSTKYDTRPRQTAYYRELIDRVHRVPGVRAAALVNNLPLSGSSTSTILNLPNGETILNSTRTISPQYFAVMGIPLVSGRVFTEADQQSAPGVAIVNEYLARQLFPGRNAVGQVLPAQPGVPTTTVVGVVKNAAQLSYEQPAKGELYRPYQQFIFGVFLSTIVVRTSGDPLALASTLRREIWSVDSTQPIVRVRTMEDVIDESNWRPRFSAWIFSILGGLALLLTSTGLVPPAAPLPAAADAARPSDEFGQAAAALIETGVRFFESLAAVAQNAPAGGVLSNLVSLDPRTERPVLSIPLPKSVDQNRLVRAFSAVMNAFGRSSA